MGGSIVSDCKAALPAALLHTLATTSANCANGPVCAVVPACASNASGADGAGVKSKMSK